MKLSLRCTDYEQPVKIQKKITKPYDRLYLQIKYKKSEIGISESRFYEFDGKGNVL